MTARPGREIGDLRRLARFRGVQTSYFDIRRRRRAPPPETLLAVLRCLGEPVETIGDAPDALRRAEESAWDRVCPPVCVLWDGGPATLALRVPRGAAEKQARIGVTLENGETRESVCDLSLLPMTAAGKGSGGMCVEKRVPVPWSLPPGCHSLRVEVRGMRGGGTVVSAPSRAWSPPEGGRRGWGVFLPLYALHSRRSPGGGDLTDLRGLLDWVKGMGGDAVGTLPLLSTCSPEPFNPSPYSPCSRLAWNEFYLDTTRAPGFDRCGEARKMLSSAPFREEEDRLRGAAHVDYRRGMERKRRVLEILSRRFFSDGFDARDDFRRFLRENPFVEDYAAFRAAWDTRKVPWPAWPSPSRDGLLREGDFDEAAKRYHLFVQWALHLQLRDLSPESGKLLYLDLPLGASPDGYDVWRRRGLFAMGASAGAPPDDFFTRGQDWGFPPLHPERTREEGHAYFRACLANQLRHAGILRIDHVMGLHRFFWVPGNAGPAEGTYVRYPAEELYAVVCLESNRHRARIVGEDLGTVPRYVRPAMARHGILRMFVAQFGLSPDPGKALGRIPKASVACLNTHDMPPFASFWKGLDIDDRASLGLLDRKAAILEKSARRKIARALSKFLRKRGQLPPGAGSPPEGAALRAALAHLAASEAETAMVGLEDLWLEREPQNTPGTWKERPNWMRKSRFSIEEFRKHPEVVRILREVNRIRRSGRPYRGPAGPG
ncbi:MAG: 4-alpha-glucanotransferase [Deltaproteobacteria bacterium]|nr:4-alpha-glucanotransferase [Deltaproteobacteria bacterium]